MTSMYQRKGMSLPRLQHVSIPIPDGAQDAARRFYSRTLGLEEKPVPRTLSQMRLVWFKVGDSEMELHCFPDTYLAKPEEGRHFCLEVDNLDEYRQRVTESGCKIIEADVIPNRPRFFFIDPFGNRVEITSIEGYYQDAK